MKPGRKEEAQTFRVADRKVFRGQRCNPTRGVQAQKAKVNIPLLWTVFRLETSSVKLAAHSAFMRSSHFCGPRTVVHVFLTAVSLLTLLYISVIVLAERAMVCVQRTPPATLPNARLSNCSLALAKAERELAHLKRERLEGRLKAKDVSHGESRTDVRERTDAARSLEDRLRKGCGSEVVAVTCADDLDVTCWRAHALQLAAELEYSRVRGSFCLSPSVTPCKVDRSAVLSASSVDACKALHFNESSAVVDVVIPWTNMSEAGYVDSYSPRQSIFADVSKQNRYSSVNGTRPPFSEIVFLLRSMEKFGLMPLVRRVFILYDDDLHSPPQFLARNDKVVPLPLSQLVSGTPFVRKRRRFQTSMAYLHHIPGLSDWVLFVPDDMLLMRTHRWSDFVDFREGILKSHLVPYFSVASILNGAIEKALGPLNYTGGDYHAPFLVKRCYLEEIEAKMCPLYRCSQSTSWDVCNLEMFHLQLVAQVYQRNREGRRKLEIQPVALEFHVSRGKNAVHFERELMSLTMRDESPWVNLQGVGYSDEYQIDVDVRRVADRWLISQFPDHGPWELPHWMNLK